MMTTRLPDLTYPSYKARYRHPITGNTLPCSLVYNPALKHLTIHPLGSNLSPIHYADISSEDYDAIVTELKFFGNDATILMFG